LGNDAFLSLFCLLLLFERFNRNGGPISGRAFRFGLKAEICGSRWVICGCREKFMFSALVVNL